jgi:DNA polymerase-3 subunit delta
MAKGTKKAAELDPAKLGTDTRVLVLAGPEAFLRRAFTERLKEAVEAAGESPEVVRFDGGEHLIGDVLDECRSFSLMGGYKIVVVDEAHLLVEKDNRPIIERYAQSPSEGCTLVLRSEKWTPGKLGPMIDAVGGMIRCDPLPPGRAAGWVKSRVAKRLGVEIDDEAAIALVQRVGVDLHTLSSEMHKLAASAGAGADGAGGGKGGGGARVTLADVEQLTGKTREEELWAVQSRVLSGDAEVAVGYLRELLGVSRVDPVPIRYAFADMARKLHGVARGVAEGKSPAQAAQPLKLWGEARTMIEQRGARLTERAAADLLRAALETDLAGKSTSGDEQTALEALSLRFCAAFSR